MEIKGRDAVHHLKMQQSCCGRFERIFSMLRELKDQNLTDGWFGKCGHEKYGSKKFQVSRI